MEAIDNISICFNNLLNPIFSNKISKSIISLILVLYAGLAAPKLPKKIANLFKSKLFKIVVLFFVAYSVTSDPSIALISALSFILSLQSLNYCNPEEKVIQSDVEILADEQEEIQEEIEEEIFAEIENDSNFYVDLNEQNDKIKKSSEKAREIAIKSHDLIYKWNVKGYSDKTENQFKY